MAQQSVGSLIMKLLAIAGGFLFAVAVARLLGPRGYGIVAFVLSLATVFSTFALLGINGLAVRVIAGARATGDWSAVRAFVRWAFRIALATAAFATVAMAGASLFPGPYSSALLIGAVCVPLLLFLTLFRSITQANGAILLAQLPLDSLRWPVTLLALGAAVLLGVAMTEERVLLVVAFGLVVVLAIACVIVASLVRALPTGETGSQKAQWLGQSLPFLGIAVLGIVGTEINTLLLGLFAGPREAGLFQPIARLAPILLLAREAIEMPLAPRIAQLWEQRDRERLEQLLRRSALACTVATAAIGVAVLAASPWIFAAFGHEFSEYRWLLIFVALAQLFNAVASPAPLLLAMVGDMKARLQAQVGTLIVQLCLGLALVPTFGAIGAVITLSSGIVIWSALHWYFAFRTTGIDPSVFSVKTRERAEGK